MGQNSMEKRVLFMRRAASFLLGSTALLFLYLVDRRAGGGDGSFSLKASSSAFRALKTVEKRPIIYTFEESGSSDSFLDNESIREWEKAWRMAGWDARIVSLEDAMKHSDFDVWENNLSEIMPFGHRSEKNGYYRWLAMSMMEEGGWLTDMSVYPLWPIVQMDPDVFALDQFKVHCGTPKRPSNCLLSGSKQEWNRMSLQLLKSTQRHHKRVYHHTSNVGIDAPIPSWTDDFALQEIVSFANGRPNAQIESHVLSTPAATDIIPLPPSEGDETQTEAPANNPFGKHCSLLTDKFAVRFGKLPASDQQQQQQIDSNYIKSWLAHFKKDCVKNFLPSQLSIDQLSSSQ